MRNYLGKVLSLFLAMMLILSSIPVMAAEEELNITDNAITDNLSEKTDVHWYRFEVTVEGDAVLAFHAEKSNQKPFNWEIAIFGSDKTNLLNAKNVGKGYSFLAANDLPVGTYYARVQMAQNNDPSVSADRYAFSEKQYSVKVLTCASPRPEVGGNGLMVVSEPATVLCVLDGTIFVKSDEEQALVALYTDHKGRTGPMLVRIAQTKKDGGTCFSSETGNAYFYHSKQYVSYGEKSDALRYSYSANGLLKGSFEDPMLPQLYVCGEGQRISEERAVREMLNVHFGKDPNEGLGFLIFMDSPMMPFVIGGVLLLIAVVALLIWLYVRRLYKKEPWRRTVPKETPHSDSPSPQGDITWHDGNPWIANHDNAKGV